MRPVDIVDRTGMTGSPGEAGLRGDWRLGEFGSESRRLPLWVSRLHGGRNGHNGGDNMKNIKIVSGQNITAHPNQIIR